MDRLVELGLKREKTLMEKMEFEGLLSVASWEKLQDLIRELENNKEKEVTNENKNTRED